MAPMRPVVLFYLLFSVTPPSGAMQTDNRGIVAVPAPRTVTVDGKLDDWDLSGRVLVCYDVASLRDVYSGRVAMMVDDDALYVSIAWKDPIPMGNSHDPRFQAEKGWAGDSVQLRLKTDRISHVTAWYYAKGREPCVHLEYGKSLDEPMGGESRILVRREGSHLDDGVEMAFRKDDDGRGYVQELKLPWSLIAAVKRYGPGDSFRCGIELLWGEADWPVHRYADNLADGATSREFFWTAKDAWGRVTLSAKGNVELPTPPWEMPPEIERPEGSVEIVYELPRPSRVTLAIDDLRGRRVRNLLEAGERPEGRNMDLWDGLDDEGAVVPPGTYRLKGLHHDGLRLQYVQSFASPGRPGWSTPDGKGAFYADHTAPEAVAAGEELIALACPMGEAGPHLIAVDLDGHRQWGLANRRAFGGGRISLATDGRVLFVANGDGGHGGSTAFTIWRCELQTGKYLPWSRKDAEGKPVLDLVITPEHGTDHCRSIAYGGGRLAVVVAGERRLLLLDAETGEITRSFEDLPDSLAACSFEDDETLLLGAGHTLYRLDAKSGRLASLAEGLDAIRGVVRDSKGLIYVSRDGETHNVVVLDPQGRRVGQIGRPGGRPAEGFFDPKGMRHPRQIAVDSRGRIWVPEATTQPKRTSVWRSDGTLELGLVGTTGYSAGGLVNPFDPRRGFAETVEYALDPKTQTYRPLFALGDALGTGAEKLCKVARAQGHEYAQAKGSARDAGMVKLYVRRGDGSWRHVAEWGNVGLGRSSDDPSHSAWNRKFEGPLWEGRFGKSFLWVDASGDGRAQREEIQTADASFGVFYWGQMMGDDLTVGVPLRGGREVLLFRPTEIDENGTPRYSIESATSLKLVDIALTGEGMMALGRDGRLYLNQSPLSAVDSDGRVLWTYPSEYVSVHGSHRAPAARPGLLIGPSSFYGTAYVNESIGEVFYLNGNLGENYVFTQDGLWVQSLFRDCRGWYDVPAQAVPGMSCDAMTAGGESFGGGFTKSADGRYYCVGGGTAAVVMEVLGLETLRRFSSEVTVTPEDIAQAQAVRVRRAARTRVPKVYSIRSIESPPPLDGDLEPWSLDRDSLEIQVGREQVATVKALHDGASLYLAYRVRDPSPLRNAGQDERLMFVTGDGVDLMLRTNPDATSSDPVAGDLRLLLTVRDGSPLAVLYEPVVPGTPPEERAAFSSPWRTVTLDRVRVVDLPVVARPAPGGYAVTVAIPFERIGVESLAGKTLRGDFGILRSDATGRECTSRLYWSNQATNNTNDIPDEVLLTPALWGELRFE